MLTLKERATPSTPSAGYGRAYLNSTTGRVHFVNEDGVDFELGTNLPGYIYGLELSNNGSDATNDIDIATGAATADSELGFMRLSSGLTKRLDASWAVGTNAGGLDTGSIANGTYHVWLIKRSDTGVVDVLFSTSASSPTMPANYDQKRRIGSILRESAAIVAFAQNGSTFLRKVPIKSVSATNPGTSAVLRTLHVPTGIKVEAIITPFISESTATGTYALITSPDQTDTAASSSCYNLYHDANGASEMSDMRVFTDTSAQVRTRLSRSDTDLSLEVMTHGWVDRRGGAAIAQSTAPLVRSGSIVQTQMAQTSTRTQCATALPFDGTTPQNTEGTEILTVTITPTKPGNLLRLRAFVIMSNYTGVAATPGMALFRDSTADAVAAASGISNVNGYVSSGGMECYVTAGSTAQTTFKLRVGPASAGGSGYYVNGHSSGQWFNGKEVSTLMVEEIEA